MKNGKIVAIILFFIENSQYSKSKILLSIYGENDRINRLEPTNLVWLESNNIRSIFSMSISEYSLVPFLHIFVVDMLYVSEITLRFSFISNFVYLFQLHATNDIELSCWKSTNSDYFERGNLAGGIVLFRKWFENQVSGHVFGEPE